MPAITTYDDFATDLSKWTTIPGMGGCTLLNGTVVPSDPSATSGMVSTSSWAPTDNASLTEGVVIRLNLATLMTDQSKIRIPFDYVDENNYNFLLIEKKGVTVFQNLRRDRVTVWSRNSGQEAQIGAGATLQYRQITTGDLRLHKLLPNTTLAIYRYHNEVMVCLDDVTFLHEQVSAAPGGKVGFVFDGLAGHSNAIGAMQVQIFRTYWVGVSGNDLNSGSRTTPFRSRNKLIQTIGLNQLGVCGADTYVGNTLFGNLTTVAASSWEEGPLLAPSYGQTVTFKAAGINAEIIHSASNLVRYWRLHGFTVDGFVGLDAQGNPQYGKFGIHLLGSSYPWMFTGLTLKNTMGSGCLIDPNSGDYTGGNILQDCVFENCGRGSFQDHQIYAGTNQNRFYYLDMEGALTAGYGFHIFSSGGTVATNGTLILACRIRNNNGVSSAGILLSSGTGVRAKRCWVENCRDGVQLWHRANACVLEWSVIINCSGNGITMGGFTATNCLAANCTVTGNGGIGVYGEANNVGGQAKNIISWNNAGGNFGGTNITQTTCLATDPLFVDASAKNYRIQSNSPAQDAGTDLSAEIETEDYDGWPVPIVNWPIGFAEWPIPLVTPQVQAPSTATFPLNVPTIIPGLSVQHANGLARLVFIDTDTPIDISGVPVGAALVEGGL